MSTAAQLPGDVTSPTRAVLLPVASSVALAGLAVLTGGTWLVLLAASAIGPLAAALVLRPRLDGVVVTVHAPELSPAGADVSVEVEVRNDATRWSDTVRVDVGGAHATVGLEVPPLAPGAATRVMLTAPGLARGAYPQTVGLTAYGPFGLLARGRTGPTGVVVLAHAVPVDAAAPAALGARGGGRARPARDGTDIAGLREWRPGDGGRRVHARATARHGRPVVLEREDPVGGDVRVLLATGGPGPCSEDAVARATGVLLAALHEGRTTTVAWHDRTTWQVTAPRSAADALRWSAGVLSADVRGSRPPAPTPGDVWVVAGPEVADWVRSARAIVPGGAGASGRGAS